MAEDTARAIGAGQLNTIKIAGKECKIKPLTMLQLAEIERVCLKLYKKEYIETFSENLKHFDKKLRNQMIFDAVEKAAKMDITDLPTKIAYDSRSIKITKPLTNWIRINLDLFDEEIKNDRLKLLVANALDSKLLSENEYLELIESKTKPKKMEIGYVNWWITAAHEGQIAMMTSCFEGDVTKDEILEEVSRNPTLLQLISRDIEEITAPTLGNG